MSLDLSKLPVAARARYVDVGRRYGSDLTLNQANHTLNALSAHGKTLVGFGFAVADGERLKDARDLLVEAGVGRDQARGSRKRTSTALLAAIKRAKAARKRGQAIVLALLDQSEELGLTPQRDALLATAAQTRSAGADEELLGRQLDLLQAALSQAALKTAVKDRGGPDAVTELAAAAAELRSTAAAARSTPGTPAETEQLDLLDGIIVELTRSARRCARAAAAALGRPALAKAFELLFLYPAGNGESEEPPPAPPTP